jgi:glc operon protein GlcG
MKRTAATVTALLLIASGATARAQVTDTRESIAYDGAKQIVDTCMTMARAKHWPIAIWVFDIAGQPVYFASMGARELGVTAAKAKGLTALRTGNPSENANVATPASQQTADYLGLFPGAGGVPLMKDGKLIGAVGAGGGRPENGQSVDVICAQAGIDAAFKK